VAVESAADDRCIIHTVPMPDSQPELTRRRRLATIGRGPSAFRRFWFPTLVGAGLPIVALVVGLIVSSRTSRFVVHREAFGLLTERSWAVLGFAAGIGIATAASIQVAKQILGVRSRFQQRWVMAWIGDRCAIEPLWSDWQEQNRHRTPAVEGLFDASGSPLVSPAVLAASQRSFAVAELEAAILGGFAQHELRHVFDLPIEQLSAQIGFAADLGLTRPQSNAELLLALMGPDRLSDIDSLLPPQRIVDGRVIRTHSDNDTAYANVAQGVRAGIDLMQISLGQRWKRGVRSSAVVVSGVIGVVAVFFVRISWPTRGLFALAALVLGSFFAWLTRDLTAIVERVRR